MNEMSFRRYSYTVVFKRNLQNRWRPRPRRENVDLVVPLIDGQPVATLVGWDGVLPGLRAHFVEPKAQQWGGPPSYGDDGRTAIIDGDCGVVGCCGVQAGVTFGATEVRWSHFTIGNREPDDRDYVFDRTAYETAVSGIASLEQVPLQTTV